MSDRAVEAPPVYMVEKRAVVEQHIDRYIPSADKYPQALHQAIRYAVMAGGKRLRPVLALAAYETCGGKNEVIYPAAVAVELVHCYSLIHDDMPCMDDDDFRHGQPTVHRKFGEAVALLAGDALHDLAFELMTRTGSPQAIRELAEAIGTGGMLAGQMADIEAEGRELTEDEIVYIHAHKTGKLIRGAVRIGASLAGASADYLAAITAYGEKVGLAFQIIDDILDIEGDPEMLGKPTGSDSRNMKATFPQVVGIRQSRLTAARLIDEAIEIVSQTISHPEHFVQMARFVGGRRN